MTGFYNSLQGSVTSNVTHHLLTNPGSSTAAAGTPVLLHRPPPNRPPASVAVMSFGGSGHEPFAAGFLGDGLLSAAIPGAVFASPPAAHVATAFASAAAATPPVAAIVAIVLNYQGDRLSYQRGVDKYMADDPDALPVYEIVVADDVSIPDAPHARGLAGVALVAKIAGAASAAGMSIVDVVDITRAAASSVVTIGAALSVATLPGPPSAQAHRSGIEHGHVSIGLGIHNERGYETLPFGPNTPGHEDSFARDIVRVVCERLENALSEKGDALGAPGMVILVNNLGGVSQLAFSVLQQCVAHFLFAPQAGLCTETEDCSRHYVLRCAEEDTRVYICAGTLVSSLDMNGFSVSVMPLSSTLETLLLATTTAPAWPRVVRITREGYEKCAVASGLIPAQLPATSAEESGETVGSVSTQQHPVGSSPEGENVATDPGDRQGTENNLHGSRVDVKMVDHVAATLLEKAEELGELDRQVGDGDFGQTLATGCKEVRRAIADGKLSTLDHSGACSALATVLGTAVGGTSGAMSVVFLEALATHLKQKPYKPPISAPQASSSPAQTLVKVSETEGYIEEANWRSALNAGTAAIASAGGAKVGDRTMIDALEPAAAAALQGDSRMAVAKVAATAAASTAELAKANRGRSSNVAAEQLLGQPDPGAVAVAIALKAWSDFV